MPWRVELGDEFEPEFEMLGPEVQNALLAVARVLEEFGPALGRPHVDTLNGSKFPNMKELRFYADNGAWRIAFAFDPDRNAILLVAGDKAGVSEKRFYKGVIATADKRYVAHLARLETGKRR